MIHKSKIKRNVISVFDELVISLCEGRQIRLRAHQLNI